MALPTAQPPQAAVCHAYRLAHNVGMELWFPSSSPKDHRPAFEFGAQGLEVISLRNFTGRIVIRRHLEPDSDISITTGGSSTVTHNTNNTEISPVPPATMTTKTTATGGSTGEASSPSIHRGPQQNSVSAAAAGAPPCAAADGGGAADTAAAAAPVFAPADANNAGTAAADSDSAKPKQNPNLIALPPTNEMMIQGEETAPEVTFIQTLDAIANLLDEYPTPDLADDDQKASSRAGDDLPFGNALDLPATSEISAEYTYDDENLRQVSGPYPQTPPSSGAVMSQHRGVIQSVLKISSLRTKRSIPDQLRVQRRERHGYATAEPGGAAELMSLGHLRETQPSLRTLPAPTPLHELCNRTHTAVSLEELLDCLEQFPTAVRTKDHNGRYPLHLLGDNETLLQSPAGKQIATAFANHLIDEFPEALITPDKEGFLPFFAILSDWIVWANDPDRPGAELDDSNNEYTARSDFNSINKTTTILGYPGDGIVGGSGSGATWASASVSTRVNFPRVEMWEEVEWCLSTLSSAIDTLGRNLALPMFQRRRTLLNEDDNSWVKRDDRTILVDNLAVQLPCLFPTVLLVDEDGMDSRGRALEMTVFRRLLLCPQMVDQWLVDMLSHGGVPAQRAVDFLHLLSSTNIQDWTGGFGAALSQDWTKFNACRDQVFEAVGGMGGGGLKGLMASLVTLRTKEMERAASTAVVWYAMGNKLSRPFVLGLVLIDLALHLSMMMAFRNLAGIAPTRLDVNGTGITSASIIYIVCSHCTLRAISEAYAMFSLSTRALKGYLLDTWNILGMFTIVMTIAATAANETQSNEPRNGLNALVSGLLWMKLLALLKVVNKDLSTFILALRQIFYDIRLFMLVLFGCIFMFGDMARIVTCHADSAVEDFCSSSWESYLRVYGILLGDFDVDDITSTTGTTILFILFTLFAVIVLLNVLIAIICDSYEKAALSSQVFFARERLLFVAKNEALEDFLKPTRWTRKRPWSRAKAAGSWFVLVAVLIGALYTEIWLISSVAALANGQEVASLIVALFLAVLLVIAFWVMSAFLLDELVRWLLPDHSESFYEAFGKFNCALVRRVSSFVFGLHKETVGVVSPNNESVDQEWSGRLNYLEQAVADLIADVKRDLKAEIVELKTERYAAFGTNELGAGGAVQ